MKASGDYTPESKAFRSFWKTALLQAEWEKALKEFVYSPEFFNKISALK
jgi:hypothetical protein